MTRDTASLPGSQRSVCRLPGSGTCTRHTSLNCTRVHRTGCLVGKGTSAGSGPRAASDAAQVAQYYGRQGGGEPGAYRQSPRKSWLSPGRWPPLPRRYAPTPRVAANAKRRGTRHVCDAEARVPEHVCGPCVRASAGSCVCAGDARARAHTHTRCACVPRALSIRSRLSAGGETGAIGRQESLERIDKVLGAPSSAQAPGAPGPRCCGFVRICALEQRDQLLFIQRCCIFLKIRLACPCAWARARELKHALAHFDTH